jgi:hypothetical protein
MTAPLRLLVQPPSVQQASARSDVFVETQVDASQPYVQQTVGVTVRLNYAVPLLSGQLDLDAPGTASLQQVGEDATYERDIGGRRYHVVERRFLLIPERSGPLHLPGARFNGLAGGGFADQLYEDSRKPLSAAAAEQTLQVRPIPTNAAQPWLPLHALTHKCLRLRYPPRPPCRYLPTRRKQTSNFSTAGHAPRYGASFHWSPIKPVQWCWQGRK